MSMLERSITLYKALDAICRAGLEITLSRKGSLDGTNSLHEALIKRPGASGRREKVTGTSSYDTVVKAAKHMLPDSSRLDDVPVEDSCRMITEQLMQIANYYSGPEALRKAITVALAAEHRTIQQSFMSALKLIIEDYDRDRYESHSYDARNELSVLWAHEVQSLNNKQGHKGYHFPTI